MVALLGPQFAEVEIRDASLDCFLATLKLARAFHDNTKTKSPRGYRLSRDLRDHDDERVGARPLDTESLHEGELKCA